jgi:hypothetical protein
MRSQIIKTMTIHNTAVHDERKGGPISWYLLVKYEKIPGIKGVGGGGENTMGHVL